MGEEVREEDEKEVSERGSPLATVSWSPTLTWHVPPQP